MNLVRINEVVTQFGVSSRTLRYYEEMGLLWSYHPDQKAQRHYDNAALERLKQIIVLRKLQIPIRDIVKIYESEDTAALIQAFVDKLAALDTEITALSELKTLVDDFLDKMLMSGIKKISAITLLYEETERRIASQRVEPITYERLSTVSQAALQINDIRIIRLPSMRMLTSRLKTGEIAGLDGDKMQNLFGPYGFLPTPGMRDCFLQQESEGVYIMYTKIPNDYLNETIYTDEILPGGLYAVTDTFFEGFDDTFSLLRRWVNDNEHFEPDHERAELIEEILPWDIVSKINRFQQDLLVPIKLKS